MSASHKRNGKKSAIRTLAKVYGIIAIIVVNTLILLLAVNWVLYDSGISRSAQQNPNEGLRNAFATAYDMELYRSVYPGKTDDEIRDLMILSVWDGVRYEPYIQAKTEPGVVPVGNHLTNEQGFMAVHDVGFRFIGPEQGPWPPDPQALTVFVFGGSTTAGSGVIDHQTVPAHLQAVLRQENPGVVVNVYNFGTASHFSNVERIYLDWLLTRGYVPDIAVFIDGYNDFHIWQGEPGMTWWFRKVMKEENARQRGVDFRHHLKDFLNNLPLTVYLRSFASKQTLETYGSPLFAGEGMPESYFSDPEKIARIIERYYRMKRMTEATAALYGIKTLFVWQPVSNYKYDGPLRSDGRYQGLKEIGGEGSRAKWGYPAMRARTLEEPLGDNFLWCADIQEGVKELLYIDQAIHYTSRGAELVARCIAAGLAELGYMQK